MSTLRAVIYCIRNLYIKSVFTNFNVYPEALSQKDKSPKLKYTNVWNLENRENFNKFHRILLLLNK